MHTQTCLLSTVTHLSILADSMLSYIGSFPRGSQLLCLAGEDVTKILILDKQIATDSLTGQDLQVNRIKNTNIDSNKQIATK